ncbi:MAG: type II toxin-antitoxin system RelE/ParE family toxin [Thermodesulfobacteriota bacterium]|nr:type II toxin-antitoxin system RelE/ParE family toxin [Thermodesulfobacteriota bacterium]
MDRSKPVPTLKGQFCGLRKFPVGDYLVIYTILGDTALVLRIGQRSMAYR